MSARKARNALSSALTLGLLLLSGGISSAVGGEVTPEPPSSNVALSDLAASSSPEGFELQEVLVSTGKDAGGAEELVSAKYLGAGTRNEIRYPTFSTNRAADSYIQSLDMDSCSPRTLATCAVQVANRVVAGLSASTCPHPTGEIPARASTLRDFGVALLQKLG